jgi:integrase
LVIQYAARRLRQAPSDLTLRELDTPVLGEFLDQLEKERDYSPRTHNVRLAAIHSAFRYVAPQAPEYAALAQRALAMPSKRYLRRPISFLTGKETNALLDAPDLNSWRGLRDRAPLLLAIQTGLRFRKSRAFVARTCAAATRQRRVSM